MTDRRLNIFTIISGDGQATGLFFNGELVLDLDKEFQLGPRTYWVRNLPGKQVLISVLERPAAYIVFDYGTFTMSKSILPPGMTLVPSSGADGRFLINRRTQDLASAYDFQTGVYNVLSQTLIRDFVNGKVMLVPGGVAIFREKDVLFEPERGRPEIIFQYRGLTEEVVGLTTTDIMIRRPLVGAPTAGAAVLVLRPLGRAYSGSQDKVLTTSLRKVQVLPHTVVWQDERGIHEYRNGQTQTLLIRPSEEFVGAQESVLPGGILLFVNRGGRYFIIQNAKVVAQSDHPFVIKESIGRYYADVVAVVMRSILPRNLINYLARAL